MMNLTVKVLKEMAKELRIVGYSKMKKEELVKSIESAKTVKENNDIKGDVDMSKEVIKENVSIIDDGDLGTVTDNVVDDIPTPINMKSEIAAVVEDNKEIIEPVVENIKEVVVEMNNTEVANVMVDKANIGEPNEKGFCSIKDTFILNVRSNVYFAIVGIEANGLYKLANSRGANSWIRKDILTNEKFYTLATKEVAVKGMNKVATQSPVANTVKAENKESIKKVQATITKTDIINKAKQAGEYAKANFKFRVEQCNNFRQMFIYNNETGERYQVGVGATVAGRVLEYEASNGVKVTVNMVSEDKAQYNPNAKRSNCLCVECQKEGKKHYITESEVKYLKDNQAYLPEGLKNKPLCYKHQSTTGARRAIIAGRRSDVNAGNTQLDYSKSLLR